MRVGQEHGQAINTHTPSSGRGKTKLQGLAEVLIDQLGLIITSSLIRGLLLETLTLVKGIVQLCVGIADLLGGDETLETLAKTGDGTMALGEGGHHLGVAHDESGADALDLNEISDELVEKTGRGTGSTAVDLVLDAEIRQELGGLGGVEGICGRELDVELLLEVLDHVDASERGSEIDLHGGTVLALGVVDDLGVAGDGLDHSDKERLGHLHDIKHIGIGHVELCGGELGVVGQVHRLVSELATNLVDTVQTSDNEHLEEQLGGDTHVEVLVEVVVVGDEGLGSGASSNHVHHGGLDLQEILIVQELAKVVDDLGAGLEDVADVVVHDQVQVTLTVTGLLVLETEMGSGQHAETRGKEGDILGEDGQLSVTTLLGLGATSNTTDTDNVSTAERIVDLVEVTLGILGLGSDLDLDTVRVEVVEAELAHGAHVVETTGNRDNLLLDITSLQAVVLFDECGHGDRDLELVGVRVGLLVGAQSVHPLRADLKVLLDGHKGREDWACVSLFITGVLLFPSMLCVQVHRVISHNSISYLPSII